MMKRIIFKIFVLFIITLSAYAQNLQWQEIGRMPLPVEGHRAVALDSVILIIGGYSDSLNSIVDFIQEYNPYTNSWRIIGKTKFKRVNFTASRVGDSLFIFGGIPRSPSFMDYYSLEVWKKNYQPYIFRYNPIFNRSYFSSILTQDKIYLFGGRKIYHHADTTRLKFLVEYDVIEDSILFSIDRFPNTPEIPFNQSVGKLNNSIFIFGGVCGGILNTIYRFNLLTKSLSRVPLNLLSPRAGAEALELNNNSLIIIGGFSESFKALKTTEIFKYDGNTFSIEQGPPLHYARRNFAAVKFKNSIYVFGGEDQFDNVVSHVEKLDLQTSMKEEIVSPSELELEQNYPNPFNPTTHISFKIPQKSKVFLEIFNIFGKRITTLVNDELDAGKHTVEWNGRDEYGNLVASGVYFYRISNGNTSITKKMTLLR